MERRARMTSPLPYSAESPQTSFGELLFQTAFACRDRSCVVLDRVLTAKVRAWADDEARREVSSFGEVALAPAEPFNSSERDAA